MKQWQIECQQASCSTKLAAPTILQHSLLSPFGKNCASQIGDTKIDPERSLSITYANGPHSKRPASLEQGVNTVKSHYRVNSAPGFLE